MSWTTIPGTNGLYQARQDGLIRRVYPAGGTFLIVKSHKNTFCYCTDIYDGKGNRRKMSTARLIWKTFRGEIPKGFYVYHKNGIKDDHALINLALLDKKVLGRRTGGVGLKKPVVKIDRNGEILETYQSIKHAAEANHLSFSAVSTRCNNKVQNPFLLTGYSFSFDDDSFYKNIK